MSWGIGEHNGRDIGYGVPAVCDSPRCSESIDRGLSYVCGHGEPYGGDRGCGLYFCTKHGGGYLCTRCENRRTAYQPKADTAQWVRHKLTDESWAGWREENAALVTALCAALEQHDAQILLVAPLQTTQRTHDGTPIQADARLEAAAGEKN